MLQNLISQIRNFEARNIELDFPEAAILVALTREEDPKIILTRRADQLKTHSGQVAFPGGKVDESDESLEQTALRESEEEIGLVPEQVEIVGRLSQVVSLHKIKVTPFVGLVEPEVLDQLTPNEFELDSIFHVPLSFFLTVEPQRRDRITFQKHVLQVPNYLYDFGDQTYQIWGLSSVVLVELLNMGFGAQIPIIEGSDKFSD